MAVRTTQTTLEGLVRDAARVRASQSTAGALTRNVARVRASQSVLSVLVPSFTPEVSPAPPRRPGWQAWGHAAWHPPARRAFAAPAPIRRRAIVNTMILT